MRLAPPAAGLDRDEIEPWLLALEKEDIRAVFMTRFRLFYKALEQLLPDPRALEFVDDFSWLKRVRAESLVFYQEAEDFLPSAYSERVNQTVFIPALEIMIAKKLSW